MPERGPQRYWEDVEVGEGLPRHTIHITQTEIVIHVGATQNYDLVHYDREYTRAGGHPDAFMHTTWYNGNFGHLLSDFAGLEGWIKSFDQQMRRMNHPGDTTTFDGKVVRKYQQGEEYLVDCELWAGNQRVEVTTPARATVMLPSRTGWAPPFPEPSEEYSRMSPAAPESPPVETLSADQLSSPEEYLEEARKWIGWESAPNTFTYPMEYDPIRRFCHMTKDDNPLYLNPEYGKGTRYGSVICPPSYSITYREFWPPPSDPTMVVGVPTFQFATPGTHAANLSSMEENYKPVRIGDRITSKRRFEDVFIKPVRIDPKAFWITSATVNWNQNGEIVRISRGTTLRHRTPEEVAAAGDA